MARGEFRRQEATAFAGGPSDEFRRIGHGLANDFTDIVVFVSQGSRLEVCWCFPPWSMPAQR
jgi:hypothetical protein